MKGEGYEVENTTLILGLLKIVTSLCPLQSLDKMIRFMHLY